MKLLNIDQGIARLTESGDVELLDTPYTEIGQSISEGALEPYLKTTFCRL